MSGARGRESGAGGCHDDGVLLAHLDGEVDDEHLRAHLGTCERCRSRLDRLRHASAGVTSWLRRHDPPAPPASSYRAAPLPLPRSPSWRIAAAVAALATLVAVGPARGWVADALRTLRAGSGSDEPTATGEANATTFAVEGPELLIELTESLGAGTLLLLETAPDDRVTIRVPDSRVALVVGPSSVRLSGTRGGDSPFVARLPASVRRVRIRSPGGAQRVVDADPSLLPISVPIDAAAFGG